MRAYRSKAEHVLVPVAFGVGAACVVAMLLPAWGCPKPGPEPPPPVVVSAAYVVEERRERTPETANVLLSQQVREALQDRLFPIDKDVLDKGDAVPEFWRPWLERAKGKPLPYLFLTDDKGVVVYEGALPKTVEAMLALVKNPKGGKQP